MLVGADPSGTTRVLAEEESKFLESRFFNLLSSFASLLVPCPDWVLVTYDVGTFSVPGITHI